MKVNCVYRWALNGEIIESRFDTETGTIDGVPESCFKIPNGAIKYHDGNYQLYGYVSYPTLHQYMNKYSKAFAVIDFDGIGIIEVQKTTAYRYLFINQYLPDVEISPVFEHNLLCVGHAKTLIKQFSVMTRPQMLYYDYDMGCLHTAIGDLKVAFDVNEVQPVKSYDRYLEMTKEPHAVGVALFNGYNKMLINENGVVRKE